MALRQRRLRCEMAEEGRNYGERGFHAGVWDVMMWTAGPG